MELFGTRLVALASAIALLAGAAVGTAAAADLPPASTATAAPERQALRACVVSALSLREVGVTEDESNLSAVYALKNDGAAACRISGGVGIRFYDCLLYTSPSPRDRQKSRMPSSA